MTTYYLDPDAATNGTGTLASPFNTFADVNVSGFMTNNTLLIKCGTEIREELRIINGETNFRIDSYGGGARPIINGADIVTETWQQDATGWFLDNNGAGFTSCHGFIYNDVNLPAYATAALMDSNAPAIYIIDRSTTNARLYINLGGIDPNTVTLQMTGGDGAARRESCARFANCNNYTVHNIHFKYGDGACCWVSGATSGITGCHIINCKGEQAGGWSTIANYGGHTNFSILGRNAANMSTDVVFVGNESSGAANNMCEMAFVDGFIIESNTSDGDAMGIELWQYCQNGFVRYNKLLNNARADTDVLMVGHQNGIWLTGTALTLGTSTGNLIEYNLVVDSYSDCIDIDPSCVGNTVRNNTLYRSTNGKCLDMRPGAGAATLVQNNIIVGDSGTDLVFNDVATTVTYATNYYHQTSGSMRFYYNGTYYINPVHADAFTSFSAVSGDSGGVGDPLFTDTATNDFTLGATSPAYDAGVDYGSAKDIAGVTPYSLPDCGCYDHKILTYQQGSISL